MSRCEACHCRGMWALDHPLSLVQSASLRAQSTERLLHRRGKFILVQFLFVSNISFVSYGMILQGVAPIVFMKIDRHFCKIVVLFKHAEKQDVPRSVAGQGEPCECPTESGRLLPPADMRGRTFFLRFWKIIASINLMHRQVHELEHFILMPNKFRHELPTHPKRLSETFYVSVAPLRTFTRVNRSSSVKYHTASGFRTNTMPTLMVISSV